MHTGFFSVGVVLERRWVDFYQDTEIEGGGLARRDLTPGMVVKEALVKKYVLL